VSRCIYEYFSMLYGYIFFDIYSWLEVSIFFNLFTHQSKGILMVKKFHHVKSSVIQKIIVLVDG
jgi:hypothetical protein